MLLDDFSENFKGIRNVYFEDLKGLREEIKDGECRPSLYQFLLSDFSMQI